jgi:phospholipid transport system substrate-binding protein
MLDRRRRIVAITAALCSAVLLASPAAGGPPTDQLRGHIDRFVKVLDNNGLKGPARTRERRDALRRIADEAFSFSEMARRTLGQHWAARTPAEREEFTHLFADLLERAYLEKIDQYSGEQVSYVGETADTGHAVVRTRIVSRGGETPVDYALLRNGDRWLVYDVKIEGISMVGNYRTQFNRIIHASSYQELVRRLQEKQNEGSALVKRPNQK